MLFGGARGGGKSDALLGDWVAHAARYGEHAAGLLVRRTLVELDEIKKRARQLFIPLGAQWLAKENAWLFPNGALLKFRYLESDDDADRYQGHQYTWIAVDEAGAFRSPTPIDLLRGTLRSAAGVPCVLRLTANPGGRGHKWLKERYIDPAPPFTPFVDAATGTRRVFIPSRLQDNPALLRNDPGYVQRLRATGPSHIVKAWLEGDWNISPQGQVFLPHFWRYRRILPDPIAVWQSWDIASKAKEQNDRSVCTTWYVYHDAFQLVDVWADRVPFPDLKRQAVALAEKHRPHQILIEDTSSGTALVQELQRETMLPIKPITPKGDKYARALAITPTIEAGRVFLPDPAPTWLPDFLDEVGGFPDASHDDIVDSLSQALLELRNLYTFGEGPAYEYQPVVTPSANKTTPQQKRDDFFTAPDDDDDDEESDWRLASGTW